MEFSDGELMVMEELWKGDVLDENGEIQALSLSKILMERHNISKTSCYTFFGRLVEKGAIARGILNIQLGSLYQGKMPY